MNETTIDQALAPPVARKCAVAQVLPAAVIELLRSAPLNPVARANVLAHVLKPVPPELATFEQIVDWIETTIEPRRPYQPQVLNQIDELLRTPIIHQRPPQAHPVEVTVEYSDVEFGTCHYSVSRYGERRIGLNAEELLQYAQDADNITGMVDAVAEHIDAEADDNWPNMEWGDDYDTDRNEATDNDNAERQFSRRSLREQVANWLQRNQPELYQRLNDHEPEQEENE